jgi:hypothetical protein
LKPLFQFAGHSTLGEWIRDSRYAFPAFEMVHLLGLGVLLGAMLLFNARFFGLGMRRQRLSELAEDFAPWTRLSLIVMALSGVPLFCSKALDLWDMDLANFTWKMSLIGFGVVWHYAVQVPLARREDAARGRWAAVVSLTAWFGAALAGLSLEFL